MARVIAANAVYAEARRAFRGCRTRRAIGGSAARTRAIARKATFVVGIGVVGNDATDAVGSAAFFRRRARITRSGALITTANAIDAIRRQTLRCGGARHAIVVLTHSDTRTRPAMTFLVRVGIVLDVPARAIRALALFRCRTRLTGPGARRIATNSVDAIARSALRARYAGCTIGQRRLRLITRACTVAFAGTAFIIGIAPGKNRSTHAVVASALARFRARVTPARANVSATKAVHAKIRQTLGFVRARHAIVLLAHARAITCATPTFVIGIFVIRNGATRTVGTLVFLDRRARLTRT